MQRKGLGRGLADLISPETLKQGASLVELRPNEIEPNPYQPRKAMPEDSLEELTRSIERQGIVQPLVVRPVGDGTYQLVTGERRWRASQRAGLATVPCLVRETSDEEALQLALVENLQREDLNPIDATRGYRQLIDEFAHTQEQVAAIVGMSRSAVANTLRLLDLPAEVQEAIEAATLSEGHGRALLGVGKDAGSLVAAAQYAIANSLTVRETEAYVRDSTSPAVAAGLDQAPPAPAAEARLHDPNLAEVEERLQSLLGTKVRVKARKRGGTIQITYHNTDELDRLISRLDPPTSRFGELD